MKAKDQSNGNIVITLTRLDDPVLDEIVDVNGNVFVTLKNITGVIKRTDLGLPSTLSKNLSVYLDDECNYTPKIIKAEYDEISFNGIFEVGRTLTRKMTPGNVPYEPGPGSLTDGNYYPCETEFLANVKFGNIRNMFRVGTVTVQLTMVNQTRETLRICKYLKFMLLKKREKGKNALKNPDKKNIKCGGWVNSVQEMCLNLDESTRASWPHELSDEGDILVIYTSRDASAILPYIIHKLRLCFNVYTREVSARTNVKSIVDEEYRSNPNLMYVQLVGDWEDIKCDYYKGPQDTALGLRAGDDNYLDLSVGRFSAESASDVTTQVNKTIAWENSVPVSDWMVYGLGIGSPYGPGDDGEYDYEHIDIIKENKLVPNQYVKVEECYENYSSSCITSSVQFGVGLINHCGLGNANGWTSFSSSNVNSLSNGSETPFIFSVASNVGDYDGITCFAEVWLRKTDGGAVAALMATSGQPWVPPMKGQDYLNDLLTGGYDYSSNPGNGINTDHGKEILGSIVANGMILWISESSTPADVLTMKNWTLFGDCALRVFGETEYCCLIPWPKWGTVPHPPAVMAMDFVNFIDRSTNNPTSWEWTFEGGTPSSSTAQNPTVTYNTPGTYDVSLTATNSCGSDTETKTDYITVYCTSSANNHSYEYIAGVEVGDLNNTSGASGYSDYTSMTANLTAGASVSVSLTPGFTSSSYTEYWKIWIDYNIDGDFEDSGEEVFSGSGSSTVTGSFTVPSSASGSTRMRVSMSYSTYPPYCGTFSYGEVEDYTVNISSVSIYTLTINIVGQGSITLDPAGGTYNEGTVVTLTAEPDSGWQFDEWSSDLTGSQNPTTITMDSDKTVTATFSEVIGPPYTLTVNTAGRQGSVTLDPPGGTYDDGTVVTLTAVPYSGWQFDNWSGDLTGTANPDTITMDDNKTVTATFSPLGPGPCTETVGNTTVFGSSTTTANRRAMPFTMPENGEICSVTMYHTGGSGSMILGVYDGEGLPANRLGVTPTTAVSGSTGWQTIDLTSPAFVAGGTTVWLAWVYESNPEIAFQTGTPGRADAGVGWSGGMPDPFGSGTQVGYIYSIYANYAATGGPVYKNVGNTSIFGSTSTANNRRAMPFTMPENGIIESVTMYHNGGSGCMIMGVYDGTSLPENRLAVTANTAVSGSTGWQTINLTSSVFVYGSSTIWLAWCYESNPGIRYQSGTPGRADGGACAGCSLPDPFGSSTQASYLYSIYATYRVD